MRSLCDGWEFTPAWSDAFLRGEGPAEPVRLPHNARELPLHYAGPEDYTLLCGYRRRLEVPAEWVGRRLFLQFDGAAHTATVYVNGTEAGVHRCGYTAFRVEITALVRWGAENRLAVRLDTAEDPAIPPFGYVIDYLTYGGLYREAWLDVRNPAYIADVFVSTPDLTTARVAVTADGGAPEGVRVRILAADGACAAEARGDGGSFTLSVPDARPWTPAAPELYTCEVALPDRNGGEPDRLAVSFGFRTAEFRADGFYCNGARTFLRGLNRHQSFPYIGYAAPEHLQREDARILQEELACTAVRTSHYPQSQYFLDECDRRGLLVFTELPGWQHIGGEAWKDQACENVREMVLQCRNHPSVVLWGVRINESADDDDFYRRTNAIAHALDPTRATSGVRYLEKSRLLEDVYAYNDFSYAGAGAPAKKKSRVTPDGSKAYLVSEHNGHMFPTKAFDPWQKRQEQALRHGRVLDAAMAAGDCAGCFGWCMFDYQTHRDFGSGDRICYHGVLDAFRNPKTAAALYASQGEGRPVLTVGSPMEIGDYPAGQTGDVYVFTNADEVRLYKNDRFVSAFRPVPGGGLPHPPILADDTIGELLRTQEGYTGAKERLLHRSLTAAGKYGLAKLPLGDKLRMAWCMARYRLRFQDGVALYGKYVGNWGGEATRWRFDAVKDGQVAASAVCGPGKRLSLEVRPSRTELREGDTYDMAAVRVRIVDENGNLASYAQLPVRFELSGGGELAGPGTVTAEGGMCGTYVRSAGEPGCFDLRVSAGGAAPATVHFRVIKRGKAE